MPKDTPPVTSTSKDGGSVGIIEECKPTATERTTDAEGGKIVDRDQRANAGHVAASIGG